MTDKMTFRDIRIEGDVTGLIIAQPIQAVFTPLPDITAYELAQIMVFLNHTREYPMYEHHWRHLDETLKRHFVRTDVSTNLDAHQPE